FNSCQRAGKLRFQRIVVHSWSVNSSLARRNFAAVVSGRRCLTKVLHDRPAQSHLGQRLAESADSYACSADFTSYSAYAVVPTAILRTFALALLAIAMSFRRTNNAPGFAAGSLCGSTPDEPEREPSARLRSAKTSGGLCDL